MKHYEMRTTYLDKGQPTLLSVCATDAINAHSECWMKLPESRTQLVDTFEIMTVTVCSHEKGILK